LLTVEEALKDGLIDEVCAAEDILASAEKKVRAYMKLNPATWSQSKINFRKELSEKLQVDQSAALNRMLQQWWAPETRLTLQKIIDKLMNPVKSK
jgi:3,2-trans-enoyl-CoA isomerase